jgi:hypothetical protein
MSQNQPISFSVRRAKKKNHPTGWFFFLHDEMDLS